MAYPTFTPAHPDSGLPRPRQPRVRSSQYGDGYEGVTKLGINNNLETISPKWTNAYDKEGRYIRDFLDERAGMPFYWQPYGQGPIRCYRCTDHDPRQKRGDRWDITATFKQMPNV